MNIGSDESTSKHDDTYKIYIKQVQKEYIQGDNDGKKAEKQLKT